MNLRKYIILPLLLMLLLTGCSGSNFNDHMQKGKDAIANKNYDEAKSQFSMALEVKKGDEEAKALKSQLSKLIEALNKAEENDFEGAIKKCDAVLDIQSKSTAIKDHASEFRMQYTTDINNINSIKNELNSNILEIGGAFDEGRYEDCISMVDEELIKVGKYEIALGAQKEELEQLKLDSKDTIKRIEEEKIAEQQRIAEEERKAKEEEARIAQQKSDLESKGKYYKNEVYMLRGKDKEDQGNYKRASKEMSISLVDKFYTRWDNLLNDIFDYLEKTLDKKDMENLRAEEERWVAYKVNAGKNAASTERNEIKKYISNKKTQGIETRNRCIILLNDYMYTQL